MKRLLTLATAAFILFQNSLPAHCQMPCGIYHDDMVYDQIDQYVETMYKGISVINENKLDTKRDYNELIRWVIQKEKASDEAANIITTYFLQQKIKPGETDTPKRVESAQKLLFLLTAIKQNAELQMVNDFADEWEKFKTMFHIEGYECKIEAIKMAKRERDRQSVLQKEKDAAKGGNKTVAQSADNHDHNHDHDHDHDHPHTH